MYLLLRIILLTLGVAFSGLTWAQKSDSVIVSQQATTQAGSIKEYNESYYVLTELNRGLNSPDTIPNLQTPQAAIEQFVIKG